MTEKDAIRQWLFRALASETSLDQLESEGLSIRAPSDPRAIQRVLQLEDFSPSIRRAAMSALASYVAFFCLENSVRELVMERLREAHGDDWWGACASNGLREKVQKRQEKEGRERWHIRRGEHEIYYTDFGDLKSLIVNRFSDFEDLFPDQNWVSTRLDELEASRNIIAHSNVLDDREVARLRLYLQDWVRQVG